jgi:pimeloyl-ACP methyl ester carboxylesterase
MTGGAPEGAGGQPLVLVHGLGSAGTFWDNLRPALAPDFTVHTPDLPGHGPAAQRLTLAQAEPRELAAAVIADLRAQGVESPHLVGLSLGGWVALEMASLGYGRSVTALAPAGLWPKGARIPQEWPQRALRRVATPLAPRLEHLAQRPAVQRLGLKGIVVHPERVTTRQFLDGAWALVQAKGYDTCDRACVHRRFRASSGLTVPVSVAFGDSDEVLPAPRFQDRSALPPQATWTVVPDCGHAMSWDQPDACVDLIRQTVGAARPVGPGA